MTIFLSLRATLLTGSGSSPWNNPAPIREELFSVERLEQHASSLAAAQGVVSKPAAVKSLHRRLDDNAEVLLAAYHASAAELADTRSVEPAAEWLLDNYHLVEEQIREIRDDLPPGYYRQLPKLADGPFAGYPRVLGIAWAFVAHTDSFFDSDALCRFLAVYQSVQPLTIGELWAVAITLRIVLIENLRRLADQMTLGRRQRQQADALADKLLAPGGARSALEAYLAQQTAQPLSKSFAAQLSKRLRDQDPRSNPALGWLEGKLKEQKSSIEEVVQYDQQRQGATNLSVRNVITSMRLITNLDWADLFEEVSLVDARLREGSDFASMDFTTRNQYRDNIEDLSRRSGQSELAVTAAALDAAGEARSEAPDSPQADPGFYLMAQGRQTLERQLGYRPAISQRINRGYVRLGIGGYVASCLLMTAVLLLTAGTWLGSTGLAAPWLILLLAVGFLPASDLATALVNLAITRAKAAKPLPGLALRSGVPEALRTLVVMPTLLTSDDALRQQIDQLEVHFLSGQDGDLNFALLADGVDSDQEVLPEDARLLAVAETAIAALNHRHGPAPAGPRFLLLYRRRQFNPREKKWLGWERKRGKLWELNALLRGATNTSFMALNGREPRVPQQVRYVITLDADTRLPRDTATQLIGKMAHPLNTPHYSADQQRVVSGYAILQPRVTPALPTGQDGSLYQRIFSSPGGIDPYAAAVSDVYQDLFGEGSYTGKGIYDVDAFNAALAGRVPENTMLSHDLFEGIFARAGLASDVEVVEDFPDRYDVATKRQHRWTRGDWQLLPWLFGRGQPGRAVPFVGRAKMLDNLRRSVVAPASLAALAIAWTLPFPAALAGTLLILLALALPVFLPAAFSALPHRTGITLRSHWYGWVSDLKRSALQAGLTITLLADHAWRMSDAIVRALVRMHITRRRLLEWTTMAQASAGPRLSIPGSYRHMAPGTLLGLGIAVLAVVIAPFNWPIVLPFALLWAAAPALAAWISQPPVHALDAPASDEDAAALRQTARRTWRFFEAFVTPADNDLPPDNFQEEPAPVIAHRTSPTNIGLYLLSCAAAKDFGWISTSAALNRLEATLNTMENLPRYKGHLFNWYDTQDLRVLEPPYVSAVDSGNLAGHLITLANACEEWLNDAPQSLRRRRAQQALADTLQLARDDLKTIPDAFRNDRNRLLNLLNEVSTTLSSETEDSRPLPAARALIDQAQQVLTGLARDDDTWQDALFWVNSLQALADRQHHQHDQPAGIQATTALRLRLQRVADSARSMALGMDFEFLLDPERTLLAIGYSLRENRLDPSCYDLLASEARLASLFAIAKGDAPTRHWFHLGRAATPVAHGAALISWSGSMFEYLMPSLVMRAPRGSLLEQTNRLVVLRQQAYGDHWDIPWGVSESAFNARDLEFTYQYANFGVPGLGLKRGLSEQRVIAPYATGLAAMVDPNGALKNYSRLAAMGGQGSYGFYEALDFTPTRLPKDARVAIIRNFMSHHQGMTIVAIANTLLNGVMRQRFHREPIIRACELLLQERLPRNVAIAHPRAEEVKAGPETTEPGAPAVRELSGARVGNSARPITHLLSNGRYAVMLTAGGAGYSRWHDLAVTRWQEDATRDEAGSTVLMRDHQEGYSWSATSPTPDTPLAKDPRKRVVFGEDYAEFHHRYKTLTTNMEVLVSGEDDGEVRRVTLLNSGRRSRTIEFTSYAEVVLTSPATDNAHPAFAKLFMQTEYLAEFGALIATRRRRNPSDPEVWAAHIAVPEGRMASPLQYETDRARFFGRTHQRVGRRLPGIGSADAVVNNAPLANTVGTVLDPIFSLRLSLTIAPGGVGRVAFWTLVADSREALIDLIDKHHDRNAFDRAKTLAWTQAQVQLRHLDTTAAEAADFQQLTAPILYNNPAFRAPSAAIKRGAGPQSALWAHGISGDNPIVLLHIDDLADIEQVHQLLRAHEYWRMKRLSVDLVIVNERVSSYMQDLQNAIETAVRSSQARTRMGAELSHGAVHTLRADRMDTEARLLIHAVARMALRASSGSLSRQVAAQKDADRATWASQAGLSESAQTEHRAVDLPLVSPQGPRPDADLAALIGNLEFFNGLGGFAKNGAEYVTVLRDGARTPAPWINVIANAGFGFQVSTDGSGYTWAENSRENQLTSWSNDPVKDPAAEVFYLRDEESGDLWCPTANLGNGGVHIACHGRGYSRFEHQSHELGADLLQYVPLDDPIKISRLRLHNRSDRHRRITVTAYNDWVLGTARGAAAPHIITEEDEKTGALLAYNRWNSAFGGRVAFADLRGQQQRFTADRSEFLGPHNDSGWPAALHNGIPLAGTTGAGMDPCAALQCTVALAPGAAVEVVALLGQCPSLDKTRDLIQRYRTADLDATLQAVNEYWESVLSTVQVKTPDRAMDIMLNGWLIYQTLACRTLARSAFYQASGAYGFRDQLQDGMALTFAQPELTRSHILRAASRQFVEGDVQHWWLPHSGQGVRTRISDDRVWLGFATATYISRTGDLGILDESIDFLVGLTLDPEEHDAFFQPTPADDPASLFEHCARGLDQCIELTGAHGLPLMGSGDWNDGMNRVGGGGQGESVWLAWLLLRTLALFIPYAEERDPKRADVWRHHAESVRNALETHAWDGEWYRRATFDDGTWLGSKNNVECQVDSIPQSWSVLSGQGDPERAVRAMASVEKHLIRKDLDIALLFTPPFDKHPLDPGYIKGYPPGLRENGGQYSHAAMWVILAFAELGQGEQASDLFNRLNPINHALSPEAVDRYKVEPYVVAADVYSVAPHEGRGGWTWYTGAAGWMYRAGLEGILGIRQEGAVMVVKPCLPAHWPGFDAAVTLADTSVTVQVERPDTRAEAGHYQLDGAPLAATDGAVRVPLDGTPHHLLLRV